MKHYLFAKNFKDFSADELMEKCCMYGIDGPNALIRNGYWINESNLKEAMPVFVKTAEKYGLEVKYADTDIAITDVEKKADLLKAMSDSGIEKFRLAYSYKKDFEGRIREIEEYTKRNLAKVAEVAEKANIQAVVQIHGLAYPHNATTAYNCVKGLDPKFLGVKLDPGNNFSIEGYELLTYQVPLLGEYICALGEKDAMMVRGEDKGDGNKGWYRPFAPAQNGATNHITLFEELKKIGFSGPGIFMPMYHPESFELMEKEFIGEIKYFKDLEEKFGL